MFLFTAWGHDYGEHAASLQLETEDLLISDEISTLTSLRGSRAIVIQHSDDIPRTARLDALLHLHVGAQHA